MAFEPRAGTILAIQNVLYQVKDHPSAPGMPYAQEGRAGVVYQLGAESGSSLALKVFKTSFADANLPDLGRRLQPFSSIPGLAACEHVVLTIDRDPALIATYPELEYAVLMPWILGCTWTDVIL